MYGKNIGGTVPSYFNKKGKRRKRKRMKGIFGLKKDKELNTIEGLPIRIFVPRINSWRGAFLVFKEKI